MVTRSDDDTMSGSMGLDDAATSGKSKKRGQLAAEGDNNGRGLRQFSMIVCKKVESKGRTTTNEVADELVAEFAGPINGVASPGQRQYDDKNIRRRVYDAINVLEAMDIISKNKRVIKWKGLPHSSLNDIDELQTKHLGLRSRVERKAVYLQELEEQCVGLQNLIQRNQQLYCSGDVPSGGVSLPFILVQTHPHATVEVEISEDMQLVHFDFNSTPFELHDDYYVLKAMKYHDRPQANGDHGITQKYVADGGSEGYKRHIPPQTPPPLPGIIKSRVKRVH